MTEEVQPDPKADQKAVKLTEEVSLLATRYLYQGGMSGPTKGGQPGPKADQMANIPEVVHY